MSQESTQNLLEVMRTFQWPESEPVQYRLYYDQQGDPVVYTMENLEGDFIEIDQPTYILASWRVRVRDGQLVHLPPHVTTEKLVPDLDHGTVCDSRDVCVVLDPGSAGQRWRSKTNDAG